VNDAGTKISTEYDGKRRKLFEKTCQQCSSAFWSPKHIDPKFCSQPCASKARIRRVAVACANCCRTVLKTPSQLTKPKHGLFFCGRLCKDLAQRWGGACPEIQPGHYGPGSYRSRALRKGKECVDCKERREYLLLVHHKDSDRTNDKDDNLEIVCGTCHMKRHLVLVDGVWKFNTCFLTPREMLNAL
jgi:hypothetical protein